MNNDKCNCHAVFLVFVILFVCISCTKYRLRHDMQNFHSQGIIFPDNMLCLEGEKFKFFDINEQCSKIVVWIDSTECSICKLSELPKYKDIEKICNNVDGLRLVFLFSPAKETVSQLCEEAPSNTKLHDYPIYIDTANMFAKMNPCIPENKLMHSFLLDATNRVVLVGNPIQNQAMFDLYKKTIDEMLN